MKGVETDPHAPQFTIRIVPQKPHASSNVSFIPSHIVPDIVPSASLRIGHGVFIAELVESVAEF
jgi:hypothetical protein